MIDKLTTTASPKLDLHQKIEAVQVIQNPNKIEIGTPTKDGKPSIRYIKNSQRYYYRGRSGMESGKNVVYKNNVEEASQRTSCR